MKRPGIVTTKIRYTRGIGIEYCNRVWTIRLWSWIIDIYLKGYKG